MSTANKLTYLNDTKQELKQKINNLGGDITDQTTFRQYAEQLQNVYDIFPKTAYAEGSNITLSNTLKGKLDFEDDIVGYGDTSQKSYQGYNELNLQDYTETINGVTITIKNGVIMLNGNSTNYTTKVIPQATSSQFNGEYNLNYEYVSGTTNNPANLNLYNGSQEIATLYFGNLSRNQSVTFNGDTISTRLYFHNNAVFNNYIIKPMLYKGSYDSTKDYEPYTNGASPNPSYPQDIEVVRGKNRLDDSNLMLFNSNKYICTTSYTTQGKIAVKPNTTYTLAYKTSTINDMGMWEFDSSNNKTAISYTPKGRDNYSIRVFTTLSTTKTMSFYAGSTDTYTIVEEFLQAKALMLLEGDYSSQIIPSYLPYNTIEVVERGINCCSNSSEIDGSIVNATTSVIAHASVKPNTKYTIALIKTRVAGVTIGNTGLWSVANITAYNGNTQLDTVKGHIIAGFSSGSVQIIDTYTTPSNCTRITVNPCNDNSDMNYNTKVTNIMILEGEYTEQTLPTYELYQTPQTYQLSLGEYEFAKIGNYRDYIWTDRSTGKWYKKWNIYKIIFDGSENWAKSNSVFYLGDSAFSTLDLPLYLESTGTICISDKYVAMANVQSSANVQNFKCCLFQNNSTKRLYLGDDRFSNQDQFKTWLASNNVTFYYILATPTDTEITDTNLINQLENLYNSHSFTGTTIIEIDGQLPLIIKVRALKGE